MITLVSFLEEQVQVDSVWMYWWLDFGVRDGVLV